jgi:hypothetical protein
MAHQVKLHPNETTVITGLTLKHLGGGHKILADKNGRRAGDRSFAEIELEENKVDKIIVWISSGQEAIIYGSYRIAISDVSWNGKEITLEIEKLDY